MNFSHLFIATAISLSGAVMSHGATLLASYLDGTNALTNHANPVSGLGTISNISAPSGSIATSAATNGSKPAMSSYWWTQSAYNTTSMHTALRFSVTLDEGYSFDSLSSMTLELGGGSSSQGSYSFDYRVLAYSEDTNPIFTSQTATYSANNSSSSFVHETKTIDLSGLDTSLITDNSLRFDIQIKSNNGWQSRAMAIQNINLNGTIIPVGTIPEPSGIVFSLFGITTLLLRRGKNRTVSIH